MEEEVISLRVSGVVWKELEEQTSEMAEEKEKVK